MTGSSTVAARARAAWRALRGAPEPVPAAPSSWPAQSWPPAPGDVHPMNAAIALITEAMRSGGGDTDVINAVLCDVRPEHVGAVLTSAAILASHLAERLAVHDPAGPAELLGSIALVTAYEAV
ncbi:hypothetical protein [Actinomadura opuntiae]|uniref:hypothetical protein n=1 Tax=Actinomadura sp. OS1-43 TaxID=604315 RepID=UPI00255A9B1D|nr:hypothetical protein [Actinomadura sp. OS1-43]MDL4814972.1 hypothetical protein [Actinomadura sp. OS1-43]